MANYIIEVEGDIIANDLIHYAQGWTCGDCVTEIPNDNYYEYDKKLHFVKSNLILDSTKRAVPYAVYYTKKGIMCTAPGSISAWPKYGAALGYYRDNITQVQEQLRINVTLDKLLQPLYRGLFSDVFSILELFLSDVILCIIYSDSEAFEKALEYYELKRGRKKNKAFELEKKMHNFFFAEVVYHKFDEIEKLFKSIVGINIPSCENLKIYLHKRNNIAHRYSLSNIDRMQVTQITKKDVCKLIDASNEFVNQLIGKIENKTNY